MVASLLLMAAKTLIDVTDFGARAGSGQDATVAFQQAIAAVRSAKGPITLLIPKGQYDFFSPHATRRRCYYSNATEPDSDAMRTIALDLSDLRGVTVEGNGSRLVMRGQMTMLVAERCHGLKLQNLEFDFARPTVSEITATERGAGYWVGQVHRDSTYRLSGNRVEWFGEDWHNFHNLVQHFDPATSTVWRGDDPTAGATSIRELGERRLRFEVPPASLDSVVLGRTYQFRETSRSETGMWFNRCRDIAMEKVRVRAMAGFGVLFQYTENVDLHALEVAPSPDSGRTCVAAADILHFSGCRGRIRVRDSVLSAANDDAINIHGTHLRVMAQPGERQIRVRFMHPQTWGFAAFATGDEIEFVRKETLRPYAKAKVVGFEMSGPHEQVLTLDRDVPGIRLDSDAVENVTWTPSVEITNCDISKVPTRGILVTTRRPVRILGNRFFRTRMPAILVEDDAAGWYESGAVHDLLIRGNTFTECAEEPIRIAPQNAVDGGPVHRNIRIEENVFDLASPLAISARSVDGLTVTNNRFRSKSPRTIGDLIRTVQTTGLRVEKNIVD